MPAIQGSTEVQGRAAARRHHGEQDQHAGQGWRQRRGQHQQADLDRQREPVALPPFAERAPIVQEHERPQRHAEHGRAESRARHREDRDTDHEQDRDHRVARSHNGAAKLIDAPIGEHHAGLGQQIDAQHAGDAEGDLGEPEGERRPQIGAELELAPDGEHLREVSGRARIEQGRHHDPQGRLRQRRGPEHQRRARAQKFDDQ